MSSSPLCASIVRPLMATETVSFWTSVSATRATAFLDVQQVLVAESLDRRRDRRHRRRPERADRRLLRWPGDAGADVVGHVEQQLEVILTSRASLDAAEDLLEPRRALAAGRALAAALVREEADEVVRSADGARRVVHDDDAGAEHRTRLLHLVDVELHVEV